MIIKSRKKYLALFINLLIVFSFVNPAVTFAESENGDESVATISVEKFTLGQGYHIEPIQISFEEGETVGHIMHEVLGSGNYNNGVDEEHLTYLASIKDPDSGTVNIPEYIQEEVENIGGNDDDWLGQFDYTNMSGWMYLANNKMAPVGMAQYELEEGDVIRWQFSVHGFGADLGFGYPEGYLNPSDKDTLTEKIAEINSHSEKEELLSNTLVSDAYENAYDVLTVMESSQEQVDQSLEKLNESLEYASVDKTNLNEELSDAKLNLEAVIVSTNGEDVEPSSKWVTESIKNNYFSAIKKAEEVFNHDKSSQDDVELASTELNNATEKLNESKQDGLKKEQPEIDQDIIEQAITDTTNYIVNSGVNTEWEAVGVAQSNGSVPGSYKEHFKSNLNSQIIESDRVKITDLERLTLGAAALGLDARNIDGLNLVELIYNSEKMTSQGNNGPIYGLLALDSKDYDVPADAEWNRENLIDYLLENQNEDGSWALFGSMPNFDLTGTALAALAPYQSDERVSKAIEDAAAFLSREQGDEGGYNDPFVGGVSSETTSQVIIGLSSAGIDPTSEEFTKNGNNLISHQLSYQSKEGGFSHLIDGNSNSMATEQALQALVAYNYFLDGDKAVYHFDPVEEVPNEKEEESIDTDSEINTSTKEMTTYIKENDIINKKDSVIVVKPNNAERQKSLKTVIDSKTTETLYNQNNDLKVNKEDAAIHIPTSVLGQLSQKAKGQPITINLAKYESKNAVGSVYDFTIEAGSSKITKFENEHLTLTLEIDDQVADKLDPDKVKAFYFDESANEWTVIDESEYDPETGLITFTRNHLSIFGVFEADEESLGEPTSSESQESIDEEPIDEEPTGDEGANGEGTTNENTTDEESTNGETTGEKLSNENIESNEDEVEETVSQSNGGQKLPETATNFHFYLLAGLVLLTGGGLLLFYRYRRDRKEA